ncbi:hypothetical protein BXZ70DRAFT_660214 [Cristinia sonorae]|uniref:Uncharacterized protein n=1 Tax=Cristinia sonorae TaxID=1940300 RepID=A0A8K0UDN7_9AGAR|nr:hypothetical protein BXZ70DRAFT_660214 [Cristinia sonorae]
MPSPRGIGARASASLTLDGLLTTIKSDADELSISHTSNSATTVGLGTLSGRALVAFGGIALRGVENVNIRLRLRSIASQAKQDADRIPRSLVADLLELQRVGLYSDNVRTKAWVLIIELLGMGQASKILDIILAWPYVELQLFLRQLSAYKITGWMVIPHPVGPHFAQTLNGAFSDIVTEILMAEPSIIHEIIHLRDILWLQTPSVPVPSSEPPSLDESFAVYFRSLALQNGLHQDIPPSRLMVQYLATGSSEYTSTVVDYIVKSLRGMLPQQLRSTSPVADPKRSDTNLAITLLTFTYHFIQNDPTAYEMFAESNLVETISDACNHQDLFSRYNLLYAIPMANVCMDVLLVLHTRPRRLISCLDRSDTMGILAIFVTIMVAMKVNESSKRVRIEEYMYRCLFHVLFFLNLPVTEPRVHRAWSLVMYEIIHGRGVRLAQSFLRFVRAGHGSLGFSDLFIMRLVEFNSSDWQHFSGSSELKLEKLRQGVLDILGVYATEVPESLARIFTLHEFLKLSLVNTSQEFIHGKEGQPLQTFFNHLSRQSHGLKDLSLAKWKSLPPSVETFANYACHIPSDSLHTLVGYIMEMILPFSIIDPEGAVSDSGRRTRSSVRSQHPMLQTLELCHPTFPFLRFTYRLLRSHPDAPRVFLDAGLLSVLHGLWTHNFPEHVPDWVGFMRSGLLVTVGTIAMRTELWPRLFSSRFSSWFVNSRISRPDLPASLEHAEIQYLIVATMNHYAVTQVGRTLESGICHDFMAVLKHEANAEDVPLMNAAIAVLLCCAVLPEDRCRSLERTLGAGVNVHRLPYIIQKVCEFWDSGHSAACHNRRKLVSLGISTMRTSDPTILVSSIGGPISGFTRMVYSIAKNDQWAMEMLRASEHTPRLMEAIARDEWQTEKGLMIWNEFKALMTT